jgi:hypothetical protein
MTAAKSLRPLLPYVLLLSAFLLIALGLACAGPLSDSCTELRTCAPTDASESGAPEIEATADSGADALDASMDSFVCDSSKEPKDEPCVVADMYGIFVAASAGSDKELEASVGDAGDVSAVSARADGSMSHPYATIGQALAHLGSKSRIYVCNGLYNEQVSVMTAVSIYGGLSCPPGPSGRAWTYTGGAAQVSSPSPVYALSVSGVTSGSVTIEDISFTSPDANAAGASSIAALVASSSLNLVRVTLSAGAGANGAPGADGTANPNYAGPAPAGGAQVWTTISGLFSPISGGDGGTNQCSVFGSSAGGKGGLGCASAAGVQGGAGSAGTANPQPPVTAAGRDGLPRGWPLGDGGVDAGSAMGNDPGADGLPGDGGAAAAAQDYGKLSATGWSPSPGRDGDPGNPGQGGAGATDPHYGSCNTSAQSVGGGGGGAGGCGGAGGKGGSGGGASIALASVTSTIELTACTLIAGAGGTGGAGGAGQDGQSGGAGGDTMFPADHTPGAPGGNGAGGSGGAGGTGGISVGILYLGSMIKSDTTTTQVTRIGAPGAGGAAGPAGRHGAGLLTTGSDGYPGASGNAGTRAVSLGLM